MFWSSGQLTRQSLCRPPKGLCRKPKKGALLVENIIDQIFEPQFKQLSLHPVSGTAQIKGSGITYRPAPDVGDGYYWVQPIRGLCAVTIVDLTFKKEIELNYEHPSFLAVGNYAPPFMAHFQENTAASYSAQCAKTKNHLVGYINDASRFRAGISGGGTMRCVSVTMLPEYFRSFLPKYFSADQRELVYSVEGLADTAAMPELEYLFAQICRINPSVNSGDLYFESKVLELLSLIQIQREQQKALPDRSALDEDTVAMIHRVAAFLQNHCEQRFTLEALGKIFYTNKNKLSYLFRLVYNQSIPAYIQNVRLEKAKKQLEYPGISIYDIAHSIGFRNQGSFSDWFRKEAGLSPSEYRNKVNGWDC